MMRHFDYDVITLDIHFIQTINVIIICATEINNRLMKQLKTVIPIGASDLVHASVTSRMLSGSMFEKTL